LRKIEKEKKKKKKTLPGPAHRAERCVRDGDRSRSERELGFPGHKAVTPMIPLLYVIFASGHH
jgi:hypothetical protein